MYIYITCRFGDGLARSILCIKPVNSTRNKFFLLFLQIFSNFKHLQSVVLVNKPNNIVFTKFQCLFCLEIYINLETI